MMKSNHVPDIKHLPHVTVHIKSDSRQNTQACPAPNHNKLIPNPVMADALQILMIQLYIKEKSFLTLQRRALSTQLLILLPYPFNSIILAQYLLRFLRIQILLQANTQLFPQRLELLKVLLVLALVFNLGLDSYIP